MYTNEQILKEIQRTASKLGKKSLSFAEFKKHGKISVMTVRSHFVSWNKAVEKAGLVPIERILKVSTKNMISPSTEIKIVPETIKPKISPKQSIVFGEPIDFRGLRFAPVNEQGVVYLFGMISHELGFQIESVRTDFPDCEGKRCFDKQNNRWEHVRIEFEYKSSHFKGHGHNEDDCNIIVCWIHDWEDCPVEVLELKSIISNL